MIPRQVVLDQLGELESASDLADRMSILEDRMKAMLVVMLKRLDALTSAVQSTGVIDGGRR